MHTRPKYKMVAEVYQKWLDYYSFNYKNTIFTLNYD